MRVSNVPMIAMVIEVHHVSELALLNQLLQTLAEVSFADYSSLKSHPCDGYAAKAVVRMRSPERSTMVPWNTSLTLRSIMYDRRS